ncbi:unnamed protein product [Paramecium octaurelia]|uniref:Uncharacterized protein n=1 Tax=Paramecium octaurelia TaxID=43137 RepID=A0A8S1ULP6_PAROT|nr:unnamed protein product [Paramecium octaurelia]
MTPEGILIQASNNKIYTQQCGPDFIKMNSQHIFIICSQLYEYQYGYRKIIKIIIDILN